jgi:hypothetical protein
MSTNLTPQIFDKILQELYEQLEGKPLESQLVIWVPSEEWYREFINYGKDHQEELQGEDL